jgi:hypothetical protein
MRDPEYREEGRPEDLLQELGYETQDIQYKKFAVYGVYYFGFFFICIALGFFFIWLMSPTGLRGGRMADSMPKTTAPTSTPFLQRNITSRTDIMSLRRNETALLTTSGPIDQAKGIYRIPIDSAIDIIAQRGLPKTPPMQTGGTAPAANGGQTVSSGNSPAVRGDGATSSSNLGGNGG